MLRRPLNKRKKLIKRSEQVQATVINSKVSSNPDDNVNVIRDLLGSPEDFMVRELIIGNTNKKAALIYISGITDENVINNHIIKSVLFQRKQSEMPLLEMLREEIISLTDIKNATQLEDASLALLSGSSALFVEGEKEVLLMETAGGESRAIKEPEAETVIRGPRDGFVESIHTNLALVRQDIKDENLRFKKHEVGKRSKQKLVVCYVEGIANPDLVTEVNRRIESIDIDYVADSGTVEQWIEDSFLSPFPQILNTERPDLFTSNLMIGKVGIIVDGTPSSLIAPVSIGDGLHTTDDYTGRWLAASLSRMLRFFAVIIAVFLPGLFVALVTYHPGMIPSRLAFSIAATREGVPFPAVIEALLMAVTFELLQEAGVRLPKVIGQTIGIVGGLVIGEAAVSAGMVSPIMVIVTALTAIATFTVPFYSLGIAFRSLRFIVLIAAGVLGLYGLVLSVIIISIHIVNLKSIGVPYSAPFAPVFLKDLKDTLIRAPLTKLTKRQAYLQPIDLKREDTSSKEKENDTQ